MEKVKIGDVVIVKAFSEVSIVVTNVKKEKFQGVYFSNISQEFKFTPMLPIALAEIKG